MILNKHSNLKEKHAFLSASNYGWVHYDKDRLKKAWDASMAKYRGTELHELAEKHIKLGIPMIDNGSTVSKYVNDAIGYNMLPEVILYYSDNCFGTADALILSKGLLRIHDLKTGVRPTKFTQLLVYAALYCLEYLQDPYKIGYELRIYQNNEATIYKPEPDEVRAIMDKIIEMDRELDVLKADFV